MALTADVPKVSRIAGVGIVKLASLSGRPIYLVAIATRNRIALNNWDRSVINLPFGRGAIVGDGPIYVPGRRRRRGARSRAARDRDQAQRRHGERAYEIVDRPRRGAARGTVVAERLPLALHAYRLLTAAATPMAPAIVVASAQARQGASRTLSANATARARSRGRPGRWSGCTAPASANCLPVIPLIERIRDRDFDVLCTSGTVTSANLAEQRLPPDVIHQFVTLDVPRFVKRFLDHWQPDLALFVESELWPNLIMTTAARGIPLILVNGRISERSFNRWRRAPGSIAALLRCFDLCLAQSATYAGRVPRSRRAPHRHHRQPQARRAGAAGQSREPDGAAGRDRQAHRHRRGLDPCRARRSALIEAHRRLRGSFPAIAHDHRAAPSRARARHSRDRERSPTSRRACARAANCRASTPTSTSPTPWASLA